MSSAVVSQDSPVNVSCPVYNAENAAFGYSPELKLFSLIYTIAVSTTIVCCGVLWYCWRDRIHLARRFPVLTLLTSSAVLVQTLFVGSLPRALDGVYSYPCDMYTGLFILIFPLITWPVTVRLVLHHNKIIYSRQLALENFEQVQAKEGFMSEVQAPAKIFQHTQEIERLARMKFRTSNEYAAMITAVPLILFTVLSFVAGPATNCEPCRELPIVTWTPAVLASFLVGALLITGFNFGFLWAVRKDPDPLRLASETKYAWICCVVVGTLGMLLAYVDAGDFLKAEPINFSFYMLIDLSGFMFFCFIVPLQLRLSSRPVRESGGKLKKLLEDPNGRHYFGLYLATELSLENLMFYMSVKDWTNRYDGLDQESRHPHNFFLGMNSAVELYNKFISSAGEHPVNISGDARTSVAKQLFVDGNSKSTLASRRKLAKGSGSSSRQLKSSLGTIGSRKSVYFPSLGFTRFRSLARLPAEGSTDISSDIFDKALNEVLGLLASDCYPRFKKSLLYEQYLGLADPGQNIE